MRRSVPLVLGLFAGAAFFSACRDAAVAPIDRGAPVDLSVPPVSFDELASGTTKTYTVTLDPLKDNVYSDGINTVRIPAGSICDPATSSYGPAHWDAPCAAATSPITLDVKLAESGGRLVLHFSKDLRFVPTTDPAKQVLLVVDAPKVKTTTEPNGAFNILWQPSGSDTLVDEAAADSSLVTAVQKDVGRLVRRLKHFSGYYVHLG